jgi:hypothetical protein
MAVLNQNREEGRGPFTAGVSKGPGIAQTDIIWRYETPTSRHSNLPMPTGLVLEAAVNWQRKDFAVSQHSKLRG